MPEPKPIDRSKPSNHRCINCAFYPSRIPNPDHRHYNDPEDICPTAGNKLISYWNRCPKFTWNPNKIYTEPLPGKETEP